MMRRLVLATALGFAGIAAAPAFAQNAPASQEAQQTPVQVVQSVTDQLGSAIDGHQKDLSKDKEKLIAVINDVFLPHFDVDYAAILVLGVHARQASPEQRSRFARAFYNSITHRYAEGLLNYTKGRIKVLPFAGDLDTKRTVVRTQVLMDDGKTVSVDYAFRKTGDGSWKAYDVIIEGISYITNYRNQVDAEIKKGGLDNLISTLEKQGANALNTLEQDSKQQGK